MKRKGRKESDDAGSKRRAPPTSPAEPAASKLLSPGGGASVRRTECPVCSCSFPLSFINAHLDAAHFGSSPSPRASPEPASGPTPTQQRTLSQLGLRPLAAGAAACPDRPHGGDGGDGGSCGGAPTLPPLPPPPGPLPFAPSSPAAAAESVSAHARWCAAAALRPTPAVLSSLPTSLAPFATRLVGRRFRRAPLDGDDDARAAGAGAPPGASFAARREPDNPADASALRVAALGYLPGPVAAALAPAIDAGLVVDLTVELGEGCPPRGQNASGERSIPLLVSASLSAACDGAADGECAAQAAAAASIAWAAAAAAAEDAGCHGAAARVLRAMAAAASSASGHDGRFLLGRRRAAALAAVEECSERGAALVERLVLRKGPWFVVAGLGGAGAGDDDALATVRSLTEAGILVLVGNGDAAAPSSTVDGVTPTAATADAPSDSDDDESGGGCCDDASRIGLLSAADIRAAAASAGLFAPRPALPRARSPSRDASSSPDADDAPSDDDASGDFKQRPAKRARAAAGPPPRRRAPRVSKREAAAAMASALAPGAGAGGTRSAAAAAALAAALRPLGPCCRLSRRFRAALDDAQMVCFGSCGDGGGGDGGGGCDSDGEAGDSETGSGGGGGGGGGAPRQFPRGDGAATDFREGPLAAAMGAASRGVRFVAPLPPQRLRFLTPSPSAPHPGGDAPPPLFSPDGAFPSRSHFVAFRSACRAARSVRSAPVSLPPSCDGDDAADLAGSDCPPSHAFAAFSLRLRRLLFAPPPPPPPSPDGPPPPPPLPLPPPQLTPSHVAARCGEELASRLERAISTRCGAQRAAPPPPPAHASRLGSLLRSLLRDLLASPARPSRRPQLWLRLVTHLATHGRKAEALGAATAALDDPWVARCDVATGAMRAQAARLGVPPLRWRGPFPWAAETESAALDIAARTRTADAPAAAGAPRPGRKSRFVSQSNADQVCRTTMNAEGEAAPPPAPISIEAVALGVCSRDGGWEGRHVEGAALSSLFSLLFCDILFDASHSEHAGGGDAPVFRHAFQARPRDFGCVWFGWGGRRCDLASRLGAIAADRDARAVADMVGRAWDATAGARGFSSAAALPSAPDVSAAAAAASSPTMPLTKEELCRVARGLGGRTLAALLAFFAACPGGARAGLPDLLLWRPAPAGGGAGGCGGSQGGGSQEWEVKFVEVKGPRDALSWAQRAWAARLIAAAADVEVLQFV